MLGLKPKTILVLSFAVLIYGVVAVARNRSRVPFQRSAQNQSENANRPGLFPGLQNRSMMHNHSVGNRPQPAHQHGTSHHQHGTSQHQRSMTSQGPVRQVRQLKKEELIKLVGEAISQTERRYLDANEYTPWQIMHGILALRQEYLLKKDGQLVSAIDFISNSPRFRGEYWFERTQYGGRAHPFSVPYAFEGHINQFPALLSMSALPKDHQFRVKQGTITMGDIVKNAQMTVNTNEEISWTLWFLTQYVDQKATWHNQTGEPWSMARLVSIQVDDPVHNAPCGGTHGLFAIAFARNAYIRQYGSPRGVWLKAEYKLRQHIELARQLQNPDGSFSTKWFKGRGYSRDFKERIKTSGHMLEWLMMALPSRRLDEVWIQRAVQSVAVDLINNANQPAECGPMYHALHALLLYQQRVAPGSRSETKDLLAKKQQQTKMKTAGPQANSSQASTPSAQKKASAQKTPQLAKTETPSPKMPQAAQEMKDQPLVQKSKNGNGSDASIGIVKIGPKKTADKTKTKSSDSSQQQKSAAKQKPLLVLQNPDADPAQDASSDRTKQDKTAMSRQDKSAAKKEGLVTAEQSDLPILPTLDKAQIDAKTGRATSAKPVVNVIPPPPKKLLQGAKADLAEEAETETVVR